MAAFPVTNSNLSAAALGIFIHEKYGLGENTVCTFIKAGINDTYKVLTDSGKYIFRVYSLNWRSRPEILEEIRILTLLRERQVRVSYAITDLRGTFIQSLDAPEGERYGVLFSFAEGEKIHSVTAAIHFKIGVLMGSMHKVLIEQSVQRISYTPEILLVKSLKEVAKFLGSGTEEMRFMQFTQKALLQHLHQMDLTAFRQGVVHMDIWFDNLNVNGDDLVTLFDFDFCGNGWLSLDIAYYMMQLHNIEKYEESHYLPKLESFLRGYESVAPISTEERKQLPIFGICLYYFFLGIQCQRYENWSNSFLSEDYLKRFVNGIIKRYYNIHSLAAVLNVVDPE